MEEQNASTSRLINSKPSAPRQVTYAPPDALRGPEKEAGYVYRWIRATEASVFVGGTDHRGWEIVRRKGDGHDEQISGSLSQLSNRALGSIYKRNGLVYARMPIETAKARNEFYSKKAAMQVKQNTDVKQQLADIAQRGGRTGRKVKVFGSVERS